ncbi:hypothetical protein FKP32DRAFT_1561039 [Trametes sanguinea]|nr:hypothetical protein FKP32DRAFT_1561039 [Trametes sanguinea]
MVHQLPPEVFGAIASYATSQHDLLTLSCTSKAFQRAAEPRIYESMILRDAQSAFIGCHALLARDAFRAPYVKRMVIYQDPRRANARNNLAAAPLQFWLAIQHALTKTVNLESLYIHDPVCSHSWIVDHQDIKFQLRETTLRLPWDSHVVSFLETQKKLLALVLLDAHYDGPVYPLSPGALPILETFNGPLLVLPELLGCPLKRIQMTAEHETAPLIPTIVADLGKIMKTLRSLNIVGLPEELVLETWHRLYRSLMKLPALTVIELDVGTLDPPPNEHFQRIILLELRTYCPKLQQVVFWMASHRFHWFPRDGHWVFIHQTNRIQTYDSLWPNLPLSVSYPPRARVPMSSMSPSSSSSSSLSSSPASSLSSAPLATWTPALQLDTMNAASTRTPPQLHGQAPPIASLPSLAHSLSAFPNMTVVANDMVHYGTLGRTKGVSEAKLTSALRKTKQRQDAGPGAMVSVRRALSRAR